MGLFDYIRCDYPLPVAGANKVEYQSKDTPVQFMDLYVITEDGDLLHEDYDTEDRSIAGEWRRDHPGEEMPKNLTDNPWDSFVGCASRVNKRLVPCDFIGAIHFHGNDAPFNWIEWVALFDHGKLIKIELVRQEN